MLIATLDIDIDNTLKKSILENKRNQNS